MRTRTAIAMAAVAALGTAGMMSVPARADAAKGTPPHIDNRYPVNLIYPKDAQSRGEEGVFNMALYLSSGGHPTGRMRIYKSTGFKDLDNAAIESALAWHYVPAMDADGDAVSGWVPIHIQFKLPSAEQPAPASAPPAKP